MELYKIPEGTLPPYFEETVDRIEVARDIPQAITLAALHIHSTGLYEKAESQTGGY